MRRFVLAILATFCVGKPLPALTADQLVLVANKNLPASVELARYYAKVRGVPAGRVLELNLPESEAILPAYYEQRLAGPLRGYLASSEGNNVRCVVLFQGVPLVLRATEITDEERAEVKRLREITDALTSPARQLADDLEKNARAIGINVASSPAAVGGNLGAQQQRIQQAERAIQAWLAAGQSPLDRAGLQGVLEQIKTQSQSQALKVLDAIEPGPATRPDDPADLQRLARQPRDVAARQSLRRQIAAAGGIFPLAQVIDTQFTWISGEETDAAVDNELALVRTPDYPRFRWQPNPLNLRFANAPQNDAPAAVMVARIDGINLAVARRLIDEAIEVEKTGLVGNAVIDSRGLPAPANTPIGTYGWYDQLLRDTATLLKEKSTLPVIADDREQVLLPNTAENVAIYCGWYSLQNYIPGSKFVKGAVGFHVASLEMTSLRNPLSKEWVPNLLNDGVDGTLGAVGEPYLHAFPKPNEFFPLLLSGRFTLAEVYWKTLPMTSWKIALIGDPLYNPFAVRPAIRLEETPLSAVK